MFGLPDDLDRIADASRKAPLFVELAEVIEADDWERFESDAKRQNFVPEFLLRGFAARGSSEPLIYQLDVGSGETRRVQTGKAASGRYFYATLGEDGVRSNRIEGLLSRVESHAAESRRRFLAEPMALEDADRATLAFFFALQDARTPVATERAAAADDTLTRLLIINEFL